MYQVMAKSNMMIVVGLCVYLGLSLQGCASCDKDAVAKCVTVAGVIQDCGKSSACYNDNGCCSEDGVEAAMKMLCSAAGAKGTNACA